MVGPLQRSPGGVSPLLSGGGLQLDDLRMSMPSEEPLGGPSRSTERAGGSSSGSEPSPTSLLRMGPPKPPPAVEMHCVHE